MYAELKGKWAQLGKEDLQGGQRCTQQVDQACWPIRMGSRVVGHHDHDSWLFGTRVDRKIKVTG